ncbi:MAG TPA: alpha/beta hydrolase [Arcobacter sp.]|nr:alpha/beta hydrolase [Arcobacter sp.]HIP56240.1 alpha/beta hydrolase [Arcobacter sp.]
MKYLLLVFVIASSMLSATVSQKQCDTKGEGYIFAGAECIQFVEFEGDVEGSLNIVVHGAWKDGTNTLARYAPFAETLNMNSDITTVAVALPGYSKSSTNNFGGLLSKGHGEPSSVGKKDYVAFMADLVLKLKNKYNATTVNYIGHSAGAILGATVTGYAPGIIQNIVCAGGGHDIHKSMKNTSSLISLVDVISTVDKKTNFLIVYGTKDKISPPQRNINFHDFLIKNGFNSKLIKVDGAAHLDLDMTDTSVDAISEMLDY